MRRFSQLFAVELRMSITRPGLWLAYGVLGLFYAVVLFAPPPLGERVPGVTISAGEVWPVAGRFMVALNVYFPVAVGLLSADRLQRDFRLGMRELQASTPLGLPAYVAAKYLGVLTSFLLPLLGWVMLVVAAMVAIGHAPASLLAASPIAFLAITVPAFAFVVAFSLACPLAMPLPVYQILFTGYWFWANFIPPQLFPTLNGTLLTPSGIYALQGFFGGHTIRNGAEPLLYGPGDAVLNLAVLAGSAGLALGALERWLARRERRA